MANGDQQNQNWWSGTPIDYITNPSSYKPEWQGPLAPFLKPVAAGLEFLSPGGGIGTAGKLIQTGIYGPQKTTAGATTGTTLPPSMTNRQALEQIFARNPITRGDGGSGQIAALRKAAADYWAGVRQYGQARANALGQAYAGLAGTTARAGADIGQRGLETASSIEQIYQNLANQSAALAGGRGGMVTPETATSAMVPVSGAAATAAQQLPAEGASLANYLTGTSGVQSSMMDALARAQAEQGVSTVAEYLNTIASSKLAADYARAQQEAQIRARAAAAYNNALARRQEQLFNADVADLKARQEGQQLAALFRTLGADDPWKKRVDAITGGGQASIDYVAQNPDAAKLLFTGVPTLGA